MTMTVRRYVHRKIRCDAPGCPETFERGPGDTVYAVRHSAWTAGWTFLGPRHPSGLHGDYCPKHNPKGLA